MLMMLLSSFLNRVGRCVLLMMLMTFHVAPVDTALSPGNSKAGDFGNADIINSVFIFERCVVLFTPIVTALFPGYSKEKYTAFAYRSCSSPCVVDDADDAPPSLLTPTPATYDLCAFRFVYRKLSSKRILIPQAGPTTNTITPICLGSVPPAGGSQLVLTKLSKDLNTY